MKEGVERILEETKRGLKPPTDEEYDKALANRLFGKRADKMLKYAPWSLVLTKISWKRGEEPWED